MDGLVDGDWKRVVGTGSERNGQLGGFNVWNLSVVSLPSRLDATMYASGTPTWPTRVGVYSAQHENGSWTPGVQGADRS